MVFSSLTFLFLFLPVVLILYYVSPKKAKNLVLLLVSLVFYAWGEPVYILIMLFSTVFDYTNGILIEKYKDSNQNRKAKIVLISSVIVNLAILCFFKYSDFLISNINIIFGSNFKLLNLALPIGISFYTFQTLSYTIDVYRGTVKSQKNIIDFGTFITLFPQLVAGPIVQYKDIEGQLHSRKETISTFSYGVKRFILGLFKKVMLANSVGMLWTEISSTSLETLPIMTAWLGAIAFTFQIYFDFSGYSDMAIGLGKIFGFQFLENFNYPYLAKSVTEFWRRWHISLGTWFREYVYFPLGGSRCGRLKLVRNLLIVWGLTGLWHGASWNFVTWGLYFGVILIAEKLFLLKYLETTKAWVQHLYTMILIIISWVIFAFEDISNVWMYIKAMFGLNHLGFMDSNFSYLWSTNVIVIVVCTISSIGVIRFLRNIAVKGRYKNGVIVVENIALLIMFIISICFLIGETYNPFLYFRF